MSAKFVSSLGAMTLQACRDLGNLGLFIYEAIYTLFTTRLRFKKVLYQMNYIGINSLTIVFLVGVSVGAVLALQSYIGLERFGSTQFIGPIVYLSMTREFGPVFAALMVIGRAGSAITSEIGTMRITEQIDALQTLCIDPYQYLIVPRIVAGTFILPFLSIFCTLFGILAGYITAVYVLNVNAETYMEAIRANVELSDIVNGLVKAVVFGFLLSCVATYKGFYTSGGAKGVGLATTQSVVYANVTIVIADYILTSLMFTR
ncbi:MAG: ABC transporter permease [Epsilonproteobacteria bacterium]|nr:ABC transporter permease [Campylobacterota bacterium]